MSGSLSRGSLWCRRTPRRCLHEPSLSRLALRDRILDRNAHRLRVLLVAHVAWAAAFPRPRDSRREHRLPHDVLIPGSAATNALRATRALGGGGHRCPHGCVPRSRPDFRSNAVSQVHEFTSAIAKSPSPPIYGQNVRVLALSEWVASNLPFDRRILRMLPMPNIGIAGHWAFAWAARLATCLAAHSST